MEIRLTPLETAVFEASCLGGHYAFGELTLSEDAVEQMRLQLELILNNEHSLNTLEIFREENLAELWVNHYKDIIRYARSRTYAELMRDPVFDFFSVGTGDDTHPIRAVDIDMVLDLGIWALAVYYSNIAPRYEDSQVFGSKVFLDIEDFDLDELDADDLEALESVEDCDDADPTDFFSKDDILNKVETTTGIPISGYEFVSFYVTENANGRFQPTHIKVETPHWCLTELDALDIVKCLVTCFVRDLWTKLLVKHDSQ